MSGHMTTLKDVNARVDNLSRNCTDNLIPVKDITFDDLETMRIAGEPHKLRTIAQKSICWRLTTPHEYLKRCPQEIQAYNLNYWIQHEKNEQLFFRFDGQDVRAIFTPRYKPVDNFEVMERLENLGYGPDTKVQCHLDGEFMSLSIPDGRQTFAVNGDKITPGISIANSEVGLSSLKISAFFLRLVCTNGMVAKTEISAAYRHVSVKILDEFPNVMREVGSQLSRQRDKFRISVESKVDNPLATIASFNRQFQLGKMEQTAVEWGYGFEPKNNMFAIVNAYTRGAQFPDLSAESGYRLQKTGGQILAMVK
jgi:hypothetical protein